LEAPGIPTPLFRISYELSVLQRNWRNPQAERGGALLTKDESGGVWGYTKRDWDEFDPRRKESGENPLPHYFRNRLCIHETMRSGKAERLRAGQFSRLFMPRPKFDPQKPECGAACPDCLKILETEKLDEQLNEKKGCKV